jgi:hypothetical protein
VVDCRLPRIVEFALVEEYADEVVGEGGLPSGGITQPPDRLIS